jgi:BarA-like signal transduction histidine kinase
MMRKSLISIEPCSIHTMLSIHVYSVSPLEVYYNVSESDFYMALTNLFKLYVVRDGGV